MKSTTATIEPRTAEILDSIKAAFASKGFDGASMQDLARAAGMSAGNFYRYFPSKDAIIAAIVARDLEEVRAEFNAIIGSQHPQDTFRALVRRRVEELEAGKDPIFIEIAATALRRPEIAALMSQFEAEVLGYLTQVFGRIAGVTPDQAHVQFRTHAQFVMLLIRGLSMRSCSPIAAVQPANNTALGELVMATIERTLAEIAQTSSAQHIKLRA